MQEQELRKVLHKLGYETVNEKRVKKGLISSSFSYPLHAAVEAAGEEAVWRLLAGGSDPNRANSRKQTPLELQLVGCIGCMAKTLCLRQNV